MSVLDPYAEARPVPAIRFLHALNPLAKGVAPVPAMVVLVFTRDVATPLAFLAVGLVLLLVGASVPWRRLAIVLVALPVAIAVLSLSLGLWTDVTRVPESPVLLQLGDYRFTAAMWEVGLATALRLAAIGLLALPAGLTTTGPDLARSLVQQLRVPYRIGYTAIAAFRFVPRFAHELDVIRSAHRVRGLAGGRGPLAGLRRALGYVVPLLAGAIRHAERVALAMDARAFGAHPDRTERHLVPFRARDVVFVVGFWALSTALFLVVPGVGLRPTP